MSYEQRIHEYLNGDLSPEEEHQLFSELSEHPQWREELTLQMRMEQAAQKDLGSITVPATAIEAIFSSLNFTTSTKTNSALSSSGFTTQKILSRFKLFTLLSGAATLIAVGCLVYILLNGPAKIIPQSNLAVVTDDTTEQIAFHDSRSTNTSSKTSPLPIPQHSQVLVKSNGQLASAQRVIPNEPMKVYFDIGRFASVDYLTHQKIIGVADGGKIYYSVDGGKSWVIQQSGTSNDLFGINFIDTARGIVVGANGTILLTTNAGVEWHNIPSGIQSNLITVRFATSDTIYTCGSAGTIMRSTSAGKGWKQQVSGTNVSLFKIRFDNGSNGLISGEHNLTLETSDGGITWLPKQ